MKKIFSFLAAMLFAGSMMAQEENLYNAENAKINNTFFKTEGWADNSGCIAQMNGGDLTIHVDKPFIDMWQGQVFVDPGFDFIPGHKYHYAFDLISGGKVCLTVKVNDSDKDAFFAESYYDLNIGGGLWHFVSDNVIANENLKTEQGPLVFGFGWTDGGQDVLIQNIVITDITEYLYIKHPWGTGKNEDWAWKQMNPIVYEGEEAYSYTGAWGGVGFNIADNAEGADALWYAAADIAFLNADTKEAVEEPAVGTADCEFVYVLDAEQHAVVLVPSLTAIQNSNVAVKAVKIIRNGQIVIVREGVEYNALGAQL